VVSEVTEERHDGMAVLELNRPVANALAPSLRKEFETRLTAALADPVVKAIVLKGAGRGFPPASISPNTSGHWRRLGSVIFAK